MSRPPENQEPRRRLQPPRGVTDREGVDESMFSQNSPSAYVEMARRECCAPRCKATPNPDLPFPMCNRCAWKIYGAVAEQLREETARRTPKVERATVQGLVYFIRLGNQIKIGYTTDLVNRLRVLPHEEVLATFPGTMQDEHRLHVAFAHQRTAQREWFNDCPEIRKFISGLAA